MKTNFMISFAISLIFFTGIIMVFPSSGTAEVEITLWHSYRGAEKKALMQIVENYNGSHDDIQIRTLQVPHDAYADKITAAIPRGKGPDIFIFAHDRIGDWAMNEVIQPIGFWVTDEIKERYLPLTLKSLYYNEELYGLPTAIKCTALFYNRDLLAEPPKNTDEMIEEAKKFTDHDAKKFGLVYENGLLYYNAVWIYGFGGGLFDDERNSVFGQEANVKAMIFARDLLRKHKVMPEEISNTLVTSLFNGNQAAMVISGPWFRAEISPDINYGVATHPVITENGKPGTPFLGVEAFMLSAETEHPIEAFEVMKSLTNLESSVVMATEGKQPVAVKKAYDNEQVKKDPWIAVFKEQSQNSVPMPNFPEMRMVWTPSDIAISKILNKRADPEEALKEAQEKIQRDINIFRK